MPDYKIFSSDSHVSEPPDLWVKRLDTSLRFRAPRVETLERDGKMEDFLLYENFPPHPVSVGLAAAGQNEKTSFTDAGRGYGAALSGGWDPVPRLKDQDIDGVDGEILHTTLGFRMFWMKDAVLQRACFSVYNDWLAEFCSYAPDRLVGVPLISLHDIDLACGELRRAAAMGLRGAMIWLSPPEGAPGYNSTVYDPFWAAAQELEMPLVLHAITGGAESRLIINYWDEHSSLGGLIRHHEIEHTLGMFILSGVLERFPKLRVISAENHTEWVPLFLKRLGTALRRGSTFPTKLSMDATDYFHRQVMVTYMNEPGTVDNRDIIGVGNLAFASDYPHNASTWPNSQGVVERDFEGIHDDVRRKMTRDNTLRAFGLAGVFA
jgi:predicted TIM-barrel fold metal-dependent hydrolase